MTPDRLIKSLKNQGIIFFITGNDLQTAAPGPLPDDIREEIRRRKPEIVEQLKSEAAAVVGNGVGEPGKLPTPGCRFSDASAHDAPNVPEDDEQAWFNSALRILRGAESSQTLEARWNGLRRYLRKNHLSAEAFNDLERIYREIKATHGDAPALLVQVMEQIPAPDAQIVMNSGLCGGQVHMGDETPRMAKIRPNMKGTAA